MLLWRRRVTQWRLWRCRQRESQVSIYACEMFVMGTINRWAYNIATTFCGSNGWWVSGHVSHSCLVICLLHIHHEFHMYCRATICDYIMGTVFPNCIHPKHSSLWICMKLDYGSWLSAKCSQWPTMVLFVLFNVIWRPWLMQLRLLLAQCAGCTFLYTCSAESVALIKLLKTINPFKAIYNLKFYNPVLRYLN